MRAGRRLMALAVALTAGALPCPSAARAEEPEPLPPRTSVSTGYPPLVPDLERPDAAALEAWARSATHAAEVSRDAARSAELLIGAACVVQRLEDGATRCDALLRRALGLLVREDPLAGLVRLQLLDLALEANLPEARRLGAGAWAWLEHPSPLDATPRQAARYALAQRLIRSRYPPLVLRHAVLEGDLLLACRWAHAMAEAPDPAWGEGRAALWERAAVLACRCQLPDVARRANRLAREASTQAEEQARLAFWRLHLDHGLLSAEGLLRPNLKPPGPAYLRDVEAVLRGLAGNPHVGPFLLSAASSAWHGNDPETALAVYRLALRDPVLTRAAWHDAAYWGGLLPAVMAALALARYDEAEELLSTVERIAGEPVPQAEGLRVEIRLQRAQAAERAARAPPTAPAPERSPAAGPVATGAPGLLEAPRASGSDPQVTRPAPRAAEDAGAAPWPALGFAALTLAVLLLARRRRRR